MSQAGRYAHEQNKKRHAQRSFNQPKREPVETIETATWMSGTMSGCRVLTETYGNSWSILDMSRWLQVTEQETERRLRYLSKLGFLRMSAHREDGKFVEYRFGMVDVNLPQ